MKPNRMWRVQDRNSRQPEQNQCLYRPGPEWLDLITADCIWVPSVFGPPGVRTDLSRMVGNRPCQLQQPCAVLVLLLVRFCCWYCWMDVLLLLAEADGTSFLVGNSSAAIIFSSDSRPGHGRSGAGLNRTAAPGVWRALPRNTAHIHTPTTHNQTMF